MGWSLASSGNSFTQTKLWSSRFRLDSVEFLGPKARAKLNDSSRNTTNYSVYLIGYRQPISL